VNLLNNLTISAVLFMLLFFGAYKILSYEKETEFKESRVKTISFAALIVIITGLKVWLSQTFFGHSSDMSLFSAWADLGRNEPLSEFYGVIGERYFVDYPPLYLYALTIIGKIAGLFNISYGSNLYTALIKFIPILSDTFSALLIFKIAKKEIDTKSAGVLCFLVLLNPAYILNSVFWGQIDGLYTLIILWLVLSVFKGRFMWAVVAFSVGILTKPQMIIFAPLLFFWLLFDAINEWCEKREFTHVKNALFGALISLIIAFVAMIPIFGFDIGRFIKLYTDAAAQYPYASLNAANIFGAFGKNWASLSETFLGITYQNWGFIGIILTSAAIGAGTFYAKNRSGVLTLSSFTVLAIFMLAHTMHERYMFPLILLTLITFIYTSDKRMLFGFFMSSILSFINSGVILLDNEGIIEFSHNSFIALSWLHVIFFVGMIFVWRKMLLSDDRKYINKTSPKIMSIKKSEKRVRYTKKDFLLVGILTLVYAVSAFANLGSTLAPQTGYFPKENGETIIIDFGEEKYFDRVNLFAGWIDRRDKDSEVLRDVSISFGNVSDRNGDIIFGNETEITLKSVFCWDGFFANETGRFIKILVDEGDFYINEIACFDENKNLLTPVLVTSENETANLIFDEQKSAVYEYTWYDGTYFDEIYHPRTAYEYINGILPYENTHPPLGKLIISLGMMLFGVTPFGWRFFGTLTGVLMVPLSYMLSKELLKETKWAFASCFLFTFDFMHLAQTRLATIDSYTAFFVMAMFYFMLRYVKLSFYDTDFKKTLVPLFLCGVCFGLGAAVKWQGIYAGVGLAVMFFGLLIQRYIEFKAAKDGRLVAESEKVEKCFYRNTLKTLAFAVAFFVIVPFIIYFLSYLPIILSDNADISYFWENQKSMLSYHSNLTETHPFGSPWWSWPLDIRPLYAYNPNWDFVPKEFAQGISSFGNPLVWWCAIPAVIYLIFLAVKKRANTENYTVLTGFAAMYLPWAIVTRQAFIYHFFPCVIFVAVAITFCIKDILEKYPKTKNLIKIYFVCVFVFFVAFYPVLTGIKIPYWYAEALSWLPTWVLG